MITPRDIDAFAVHDVAALLDAETGGNMPGPYLLDLADRLVAAVRQVDREAGRVNAA